MNDAHSLHLGVIAAFDHRWRRVNGGPGETERWLQIISDWSDHLLLRCLSCWLKVCFHWSRLWFQHFTKRSRWKSRPKITSDKQQNTWFSESEPFIHAGLMKVRSQEKSLTPLQLVLLWATTEKTEKTPPSGPPLQHPLGFWENIFLPCDNKRKTFFSPENSFFHHLLVDVKKLKNSSSDFLLLHKDVVEDRIILSSILRFNIQFFWCKKTETLQCSQLPCRRCCNLSLKIIFRTNSNPGVFNDLMIWLDGDSVIQRRKSDLTDRTSVPPSLSYANTVMS